MWRVKNIRPEMGKTEAGKTEVEEFRVLLEPY